MSKSIITMTSITYALKAKSTLNALGYYCEIQRTPKNTGSGCGYSIRIKNNPDEIKAKLDEYQIPYKNVYEI